MRRVDGKGEYYSQNKGEKGMVVELFLDRNGSPTTEYPHVHVIHHKNGNVSVVASLGPHRSAWSADLEQPDGNEVDRAVREACRHL